MGNLRDELRKAGLVGKKEAKRQKHAERVAHKQLGQEGQERKEAEHADDLRRRQEEDREKNRALARLRRDEQAQRERLLQIKQLVRSSAVREGTSGVRSFFFITRSGKVPFLQLDPEFVRKLEAGNYCIVEDPGAAYESHLIVPREAARKLHEFDRDLVRYASGRL